MVECYKDDGKGGELLVRCLEKGQHFGELALLNDVKRTLSIRSIDNSKLLLLERTAFTRILGSINKFLMKDYDGEFDKKHEIGAYKDGQGKSSLEPVKENNEEDQNEEEKAVVEGNAGDSAK
jgi:hypothetical protein